MDNKSRFRSSSKLKLGKSRKNPIQMIYFNKQSKNNKKKMNKIKKILILWTIQMIWTIFLILLNNSKKLKILKTNRKMPKILKIYGKKKPLFRNKKRKNHFRIFRSKFFFLIFFFFKSFFCLQEGTQQCRLCEIRPFETRGAIFLIRISQS